MLLPRFRHPLAVLCSLLAQLVQHKQGQLCHLLFFAFERQSSTHTKANTSILQRSNFPSGFIQTKLSLEIKLKRKKKKRKDRSGPTCFQPQILKVYLSDTSQIKLVTIHTLQTEQKFNFKSFTVSFVQKTKIPQNIEKMLVFLGIYSKE